jgi:death-on-curing protein
MRCTNARCAAFPRSWRALPSEPHWLSADVAVGLNARIVEETGEPHFVRDRGLLESALARPINRWTYGEQEMAALAAVLLLGIARNHPFGQGNKRTALEAADAFLYLNGYELALEDRAGVADCIVDAITGGLGEEELVGLISAALRPA